MGLVPAAGKGFVTTSWDNKTDSVMLILHANWKVNVSPNLMLSLPHVNYTSNRARAKAV